MTKIKIAIILAGVRGEHVVSLRSAASIMETLDRDRYDIIPVGITREGGVGFPGGEYLAGFMEK